MHEEDIWHYEDFEVGHEGRTHGRLITDAEVLGFAALSGDYHPIHFDPSFGQRETAFGQRVAHGLIGVSVATGLLARDAPEILGTRFAGYAFLGVEWRFREPILVGDTLYTRYRIASKRDTRHADRGIVELEITMENQDGKTLQTGQISMMMARRTPRPGGAA